MKKIIPVLIFAAILSTGTFFYLNRPPSGGRGTFFQVNYGETVRTTAERLEKNQIITSADFFVLTSYALRRKYIKAGKYEFHPGMTSIDILKKLTRGDILTSRVTIPEGFNLYQTARRLEESRICDEANFLFYAFDENFLASIGIYSSSAEGYLFPDTYVFPESSDPRDVIAVMHKKMSGEVELITGVRAISRKKKHEILTLASLIEEEAKIPDERKLISSVFHNRMKKKMKLDCDPTVRYGVKNFERPITVSELADDSPYNTYKYRGLPPTPISSPGRESIDAAINPAKSSYLFFVARNDGSHYFSTTLREHNRAVEFYQRGRPNGFKDRQKR